MSAAASREGSATRPRLRLVAEALVVLALLPWMTALVVSGALVAPLVFGIIGDPSAAGEVMQPIFIRLGYLYVGLAGLLVAGEILRGAACGWRILNGISLLRLPLAAVLALMAYFSAFVISPEMKAIRDGGMVRGQDAAWVRFEELHDLSETLAFAELALGAVLLALVFAGAWRRARR